MPIKLCRIRPIADRPAPRKDAVHALAAAPAGPAGRLDARSGGDGADRVADPAAVAAPAAAAAADGAGAVVGPTAIGAAGWFTLAITVVVLLAMVRDWAPPDVLFVGAAVLLALFGVLEPDEAFGGFSNAGVLTVAGMFVVAAGLRETGVLDEIGDRLLGRVGTAGGALRRLTALVLPSSAVINNTPIVAMLMPVVVDWCRRRRVSPSELLMHLSFLSILGGCCTLIGTSTNLVVHGLLLKRGDAGAGVPGAGVRGGPLALVGAVYLLTVAPRLIPVRKDVRQQLSEARREYLAGAADRARAASWSASRSRPPGSGTCRASS